MYKELFFVVIGLAVGIYCGYASAIFQLKPALGDDYEINKPKIKGQDNTLEVIQQNSVSKKQGVIKRILKRKRNGSI